MSNRRRIEALRNLAARPGTEAEGEVAKAKLAEAEAKAKVAATKPPLTLHLDLSNLSPIFYVIFVSYGPDVDEFIDGRDIKFTTGDPK